ncbi:hypothetical protein SOVF_071050 [Spinacia oleracea]|nr:hypothetical protein SOVF_071050 [Spinacia oleracea]
MPTSPTRSAPGFKSGSITPEIPENFSPYAENFEFEESKRFYPYDNGFYKSGDLSVAYADELFCDGKMVPLRLPPQVRCTRPSKRRGNDSTGSSPGARTVKGVKVPFLRQRSLWNDGYDPFLAALNKVKEDNDVISMSSSGEKKAHHLRRSKSLSPFRRPNGSTTWKAHKYNKVILSPGNKPNSFGPIQGPKDDIIGKSGSLESRKQRIKKYLLNFGKDVNGEQKTPLLFRKKMHNPPHRLGSKYPNAVFRISREMKSLMKHRARFFFCLAKVCNCSVIYSMTDKYQLNYRKIELCKMMT